MLQIAFSLLVMLFTVSCGGPRYVDYFPYHDDGTLKPKVAMIPLIDSSQSGLTWNLSEEITSSIYYNLMDSGELYVLRPQEIGPVWAKRDSIDFFAWDMSYAREFCNTDFIVAMELIEHAIAPCDQVATKSFPQCHPSNNVLTMRVRLKVIDTRCQTPRVVLYEIVKAEYLLPPFRSYCDVNQIRWGSRDFDSTPCGILHQRMVKNIATRLEEVLWSAR